MYRSNQARISEPRPPRHKVISYDFLGADERHPAHPLTASVEQSSVKSVDSQHLELRELISILPAGFPLTGFRVGNTQGSFNEIRNYGELEFTLESDYIPIERDLLFLLGIMHLAMRTYSNDYFTDEAEYIEDEFTFTTSFSELRQITGSRSNDDDLITSLHYLNKLYFSVYNIQTKTYEYEPDKLIQYVIESEGIGSTRDIHIRLHELFAKTLMAFVLGHDVIPFTLVYLSEYRAISGDGYKAARLLHTYFSQSVAQGRTSTPHGIKTLVKKIYGNSSKDFSRQKLKTAKSSLVHLESIGWKINSLGNNIFSVVRPKRKNREN